jgi:predicted enzyme related to lactoylglutathione lyase
MTKNAARRRSASPERRRVSAKSKKASAARKHKFTRGLYGHITHTDLASTDPSATKEWCRKVLGWRFTFSMPVPGGEIHMFAYSPKGGGGIRPTNPTEMPGSIPHIHVPSCADAYAKALQEGAEEMMSPTRVMEGVTVAIVRAPGGVPIGFSGP